MGSENTIKQRKEKRHKELLYLQGKRCELGDLKTSILPHEGVRSGTRPAAPPVPMALTTASCQ